MGAIINPTPDGADVFGEVITQDVLYIDADVEFDDTPIIQGNQKCCPLRWLVLATNDNTNPLYNDFSSPIKFFPIVFTPTMVLQKCEGGVFVDKATLNDNTYGTAYDLRIKDNIKPYGHTIDWQLVLPVFGVGVYRVKFDYTFANIFSDEYQLKIYSEEWANRTVRFETTRNRRIGSINQKQMLDFKDLNWVDQYRYEEAFFGRRKASLTQESNRLNGGKKDYYLRESDHTFSLELRYLQQFQLKRIFWDLAQNDITKVTDYNDDNIERFEDIEVKLNSEIEPRYHPTTKFQSVDLEFIDGYDNNRKLYS